METGLHYNRYRYYELHSSRYIGKDPIGLDGGFNNSAYVSDPNAWIAKTI
nr:RHS repeat-associated core domain-containing protein [Acinetobacter larvae]